jgi:hypothetical protein
MAAGLVLEFMVLLRQGPDVGSRESDVRGQQELRDLNRQGAKDAKKNGFNFFIAACPIKQKKFYWAGSNKKASSLPCTYLGLRL